MVAIAGAQTDPTKPGSGALKNLIAIGRRGKAYPINPSDAFNDLTAGLSSCRRGS